MDGQDCIELVAVDVERDQSRINSGGAQATQNHSDGVVCWVYGTLLKL